MPESQAYLNGASSLEGEIEHELVNKQPDGGVCSPAKLKNLSQRAEDPTPNHSKCVLSRDASQTPHPVTHSWDPLSLMALKYIPTGGGLGQADW